MFASNTIIGVVASLTILAAPVSARTWAGGVDMNAACVDQWHPPFQAQNDKENNDANSAFDWYCSDGINRMNVDVNAYCYTTYVDKSDEHYGVHAYADPQGMKKYDWGCYYPF
ncbi:uncharacterized protein LY79DRAFT_560842 [Colletotrichum navitas]|uniref:Uncharacterized protein n=1 Tax=Colletotrichum navitas TaxID=681940 RepID=A0AAD8V3I7_9PEZI|nr:uncharacterized protein LY79DRAFT_560842 [Colletotrichum navitas]KAK1580763.1 hypothetical protein LY79DRAFT_560842 [Colletotrichum navitas]